LTIGLTALLAGVFDGFIGNLLVNYFTKNLDFKYDYNIFWQKKKRSMTKWNEFWCLFPQKRSILKPR